MAISQTYSVVVRNHVSDISVVVLSITEDRLENILIKHVNRLKKNTDWVGALVFFLSQLTVLITAEFQDRGLDAKTWQGLFLAFFIASGIYLGCVIYNRFKHNDSVEAIMSDIKDGQYCQINPSRIIRDSSKTSHSPATKGSQIRRIKK